MAGDRLSTSDSAPGQNLAPRAITANCCASVRSTAYFITSDASAASNGTALVAWRRLILNTRWDASALIAHAARQ